MTGQHPAGYSRAAGIALVVAAVAGAASQDACTCCGENPGRRDTGLCGVCIGNRCQRCADGQSWDPAVAEPEDGAP